MHQARPHFTRHVVVAITACWLAWSQAAAKAFDVAPWSMPETAASAAQPDLANTSRGDWLLSWVEKHDDGLHALRFSRFEFAAAEPAGVAGRWQTPITIASGRDWFVNWADTPHLLALDDGTLWAHWLRRNGKGIHDYGIALVRSDDDGRTWSAPIRVEPDGAKNDYGFVSMWQHARGELGLAWLDSRQKPVAHDAAHGHDHAGAPMMLRAAVFDSRGKRGLEWPLDASTCDCCTTSSALTARGPVLVYRGRSAGEIRDTRLVRFDGKHWSQPVSVHDDGWHFAGCPVNGPAVAARGNEVWVAWYTEADGKPSLRLGRSRDTGDTFTAPIAIAEGDGMLGRAAVAIDKDVVWLAWLAERDVDSQGQHLWLARIDARSGAITSKQRIADISARGRASGLPRMQVRDGVAGLVWTDVVDGKSILRGIIVR